MTMKACALLTLVTCLACTSPAASQVPDETAGGCTALINRLDADVRPSSPPRQITAAGPDTCRFEGVHLAMTSSTGWDVGSVIIKGIPSGTSPIAMRMEAKDIVFALHTGRAAVDWMNRQQQVPFNVTLDLTYDPGTKLAVLKELSMTAETGSVLLDGLFENVEPFDPLQPSKIAPPSHSRIKALHLHIESRRFIAGFVLPLILPLIPEGDPGAIVDGMKTMTIALVHDLLPAAPPEAVKAVTDFVQDFPRPRHPFDLSLQDAGPGFGASDLALLGQGRNAQIERLKQLKVEASYAGELR